MITATKSILPFRGVMVLNPRGMVESHYQSSSGRRERWAVGAAGGRLVRAAVGFGEGVAGAWRASLALRELGGLVIDQGADVSLEPADHDRAQLLDAADRDAAGEALGVEDLQEGREAVAVAVVGGRGEEQAILEARGDAVADDAGDLRVEGVAAAGRRG
jgi:hypothetical protein